MPDIYTATSTATGGRLGRVRSSDGVLDVALAMPKAMGGPGGEATNPEQLFAAGYAACFDSALRRVFRNAGTPITHSSVTAHVTIARGQDGYFKLSTVLEVSVPGRDRSEVEAMATTAHEEVCPYSHATRGNMPVDVKVV